MPKTLKEDTIMGVAKMETHLIHITYNQKPVSPIRYPGIVIEGEGRDLDAFLKGGLK